MALRIRECLKEDGAYWDSPAFHGHNCRLLDRNVRRHPLKHAHPAANSLPLNILPTSLTGSIFCGDFRLSPPVFSIFYGQGGRGRGGAPPRYGPGGSLTGQTGTFPTLCRGRSYRTIPQCNARYSKEAPQNGITSSTRAQHSV